MTPTAERANVRRNARGHADRGRRARWAPARAAAWELLDGLIEDGARVALVGPGNGDDLPLRPIARRAATVALFDLDRRALRRSRMRCRLTGAEVTAHRVDVTGGAADAIVAMADGHGTERVEVPRTPLARGGFDVVVADLLLTQLLYPALRDAALPMTTIDRVVGEHGQQLTDAVVARLAASAPGGATILLHDVLGWWPGHEQPFALDDVLAAAQRGTDEALEVIARGDSPSGCDARLAATRAGLRADVTRFWRWPFAPGTEYLVCATVALPSDG